MKTHYELVVVVPVGPNVNIKFVLDSIASVHFYCRCSQKFIISDDSQQGLGKLVKEQLPEVDVLLTTKLRGSEPGYGALYINLSHAFKHAIDNYVFNSLLKLDTDALVIGANPQHDAEQLFSKDPAIGMAGLYKTGKETYDFNN